MKVLDVMTTDVLTVRPDTLLKEAARTMVQSGVSGLPVVDEADHVVGIVTEADFLGQEAEREGPRRRGLLDALFHQEPLTPQADRVGDVMTQPVTTISVDASVSEAARRMAGRGIKRLPVVDGTGRLVGIVSRADIVAAFSRPDDVIEDEIRNDLIHRILFIDPDALDVTVTDGVVHLAGEMPSRSEVQLLQELVRRLNGVVRVENELSWEVDDTKAAPNQQASPF